MPKTGAVIVAAGRSSRMGGVDKVFASLAGRPLLCHALGVFEAAPEVETIVLVTAADRMDDARRAVAPFRFVKLASICAGGERRQDSVRVGLEQLGHVDVVVIHDAVRPMVTAEMIRVGLIEVAETGAAIAAIPAVDTLKEADSDGNVIRTIPRERLWAVQTPQVFDYELLLEAHLKWREDVTDDAMLIEALGRRIKLFLGSPRNIKVTTPDDLVIAEALLAPGDSTLRAAGRDDR